MHYIQVGREEVVSFFVDLKNDVVRWFPTHQASCKTVDPRLLFTSAKTYTLLDDVVLSIFISRDENSVVRGFL